MLSYFLLSPLLVAGHPGHGVGTGDEIFHYFVSPYHMGLALFFIVLLFILVKVSPRKKLKT